MKHLKQYESNIEGFWIVVFEDINDPEDSHQDLFDDALSAENFYIKLVNDEIEKIFEFKNKKITINDIITTREDADDWLEDNTNNCRIYFYKIKVQEKFELPENIKLARETRKYNL